MNEQRKQRLVEMDAFEDDFRGLLDQIAGIGNLQFGPGLTPGKTITDVASLRTFLRTYASRFLFAVELPAICKAYHHTARFECRELIALDKDFSNDARMQQFAKASSRIGRSHLLNLRPLRENRLVQRYLAALDSGEVQAWNTLVYGVSLSIYSVPLRQGLLAYAKLVLDGFAGAAAASLAITSEQLSAIVDEITPDIPKQIDALLGNGENLIEAA